MSSAPSASATTDDDTADEFSTIPDQYIYMDNPCLFVRSFYHYYYFYVHLSSGPSSAGEEHLPAPESTDPTVPSVSVLSGCGR